MKKLAIGILAHVDSGKTTLSEGLLYSFGMTKKLGRVDHKDAYLDTNKIERDRGITIFSKQAIISSGTAEFTLLDTPGHIDFSAEMERTLQVLDYAILVISGTDGVQSHTETLWRLLCHHSIPTFIFVNKMDLAEDKQDELMAELSARLSDNCVDFSNYQNNPNFSETVAMCDEILMEEYLKGKPLSKDSLRDAIFNRNIFPCCFGSALKLDGIDDFSALLNEYTKEKPHHSAFGAKVFKISEDDKGNRLTHLKITGGTLKVKELIGTDTPEKVNEIRIYSGEKYTPVSHADTGTVCAITGPVKTYPGMGLGREENSEALSLEPIFTYSVILPKGVDLHTAISNLKQLGEEETQLHIMWNEQLKEIQVQIMGEVQLEVLKSIIAERFKMAVEFEKGSIIYKETIAEKVEGVGHFEPLRHYAEVHLLLEPIERGSGLKFSTKCNEDELDRNWQRLIMTHLEEKTHLGVLTGSPITDMKITLVAGKAHIKHTEGGDFRQATYRAIRQGLMQAKNVLLEPWFKFSIELPTDCVGRAMTDISQMGGELSPPETIGEISYIKGTAPAAKMRDYQKNLTSYTRGRGRISCSLSGYEPCSDTEQVIDTIGYDPEADPDNTPDSVFCSHGSGFVVKWDQVADYMHLPAYDLSEPEVKMPRQAMENHSNHSLASDEELLKIFEQTYGKVVHRNFNAMQPRKTAEYKYKTPKPKPKRGDYMLIDGYNIIFAWKDLKDAADIDLEYARNKLLTRVSAYRAMRNVEVILVFDAYKVKGNPGSVEKIHNVNVVYTKEAETADSYIEKTTHELGKNHNVRVATSDYMEQLIILGNGAFRISADEFRLEVEAAENEIRELINENRG